MFSWAWVFNFSKVLFIILPSSIITYSRLGRHFPFPTRFPPRTNLTGTDICVCGEAGGSSCLPYPWPSASTEKIHPPTLLRYCCRVYGIISVLLFCPMVLSIAAPRPHCNYCSVTINPVIWSWSSPTLFQIVSQSFSHPCELQISFVSSIFSHIHYLIYRLYLIYRSIWGEGTFLQYCICPPITTDY